MKREFATAWWVRTLGTMDFMPNECRIVIRGPSYAFYHKYIYGPAARALRLELSYKPWRECAIEALRDLSRRLPSQVWDRPSQPEFGLSATRSSHAAPEPSHSSAGYR